MTLAADIGAVVGGKISDWLQAQSNLAGQIIPWPAAGNIPVGWLECDGRMLNSAEYPRLFAVIGTAYGGDGVATFNLPDLRGRVPLGRSASRAAGTQVGAESVSITLDGANLPSHTHTATFTSSTPTSTTVSVAIPANATTNNPVNTPGTTTVMAKGTTGSDPASVYTTEAATTTLKPFDVSVPVPAISGSVAIGSTGAGQPLSIPTLPPSLVMTWIICTGIGITQPIGYSWHGVKTTYQSLSQADLTAKLAADAEFSSAVTIMLASGLMPDRVSDKYARWNLGQAKHDAVNFPLTELLNRLNPMHVSYSQHFADMYKILVGSGVIVERRVVRRLAPQYNPDSSTTFYSWTSQADGLPSGSLSAPSVYGNDPSVGVSRVLDSPAYSSYTFPGSGSSIGWYLQYELDALAIWQRLDLRLSSSRRPTQINISAGVSLATLVSIGDFTVSGTVTGEFINAIVAFNTPPAKILRATVIAVGNPLADGYPIYNAVPYGVLLA